MTTTSSNFLIHRGVKRRKRKEGNLPSFCFYVNVFLASMYILFGKFVQDLEVSNF